MSLNLDDVNGIVVDILREIGNIGSGNAATSLAKMIDKKVDMKVPKVQIIDATQVDEILGGAEIPVCGIYFMMHGEIEGNIMFILNIESANNLLALLLNRANDNPTNMMLSEMDISALSEIGNILAASYINSISKLTNLSISISIPSVNIDMAGAILSVPAVQYSELGDKLLFIETEFIEDNKLVSGDFFLIPDIDSFEILLKRLGVM